MTAAGTNAAPYFFAQYSSWYYTFVTQSASKFISLTEKTLDPPVAKRVDRKRSTPPPPLLIRDSFHGGVQVETEVQNIYIIICSTRIYIARVLLDNIEA